MRQLQAGRETLITHTKTLDQLSDNTQKNNHLGEIQQTQYKGMILHWLH